VRRIVIAAAAGLLLTACGSNTSDTATSTSSPTTETTTVTSAAPSTAFPYTPPPFMTTSSAPVFVPEPAAPSTDSAPVGVTCADVGGVFVAHGTDGRGDCESADPRSACHIEPAQQPDDYLAELTMTPPFPEGTIDYPFLISTASNADCWKAPDQ
jgi:hypothetical protein